MFNMTTTKGLFANKFVVTTLVVQIAEAVTTNQNSKVING